MDAATAIFGMVTTGFIGFFIGLTLASINKGSARSSGFGQSGGGTHLYDSHRLESKVDVLLKHFDLTSEAESKIKLITDKYGVPAEVLSLLPDKKIEAIKIYRTMSGVGLKEAKDKIDEVLIQMRR